MDIAELRKEMGLTLQAFGALIGIESRGRMSVIERENSCSLPVALAIEALSGGRVDAATLNNDVRLTRHGLGDSAAVAAPSPGKSGAIAPSSAEAA